MRKAAPVEYVRVCTAYGAGFFYIPGTDTCLRVGGRARFAYQYTSQRTRNADQGGFRTTGRLNLDTRTQTAYGTLRAFVRFDIDSRTGAYFKSGTAERYGFAYFATGQDTRNSIQTGVNLDKAFIQFAGFTAGRAASFYDFYASDVEIIGSTIGSNQSTTNLLAYTATFGGGFSATLSVEDPTFRRNPTFAGNILNATNTSTAGLAPTAGGSLILGNVAVSPVGATFFAGTNLASSAINLDVTQRNVLPDFVGVLRYDAAWGSAQFSGAVHELRTGNYTGAPFVVNGFAGPAPGGNGFARRVPGAEYGFALQGGLKLNVPQIAPGDVLWLQAAYGRGAGHYTGIFLPQGQELNGSAYTNRFAGTNTFGGYDMAVDALGRTHLTESWSGVIAFTHYWTPEVRSSLFGSYGRATFDKALRSPVSPVFGVFNTAANFATPVGGGVFSGFGRDYSNIYVGANTIWSPIKDFDIGAEIAYERLEFLGGASRGRVLDSNKAQVVGGVPRTIKFDDNFLVRMRVQRDF